MSADTPVQRVRPPLLPEIAERLTSIMATKKGRKDVLSTIGATSDGMMTQIKDWFDKEMASLREQLDLLEMARWDMVLERRELETIDRDFDAIISKFEQVREQAPNASTEQQISDLTETYIATFGEYIRNVVRLSALTDKIDRRSNDLLQYRDSLIDLAQALGRLRTST